MKKILLFLLIMIIAVPAFAKDPKETVEYWKNNPNGTKRLVYRNKPTQYALSLMNKGDKQQ